MYPESSGSLASGPAVGLQERLWGTGILFNFFDWLPRDGLHCYCRNPAVMKFQFPRVSPGDQPLAKEPEDSGYEIGSGTEIEAIHLSV